MDKEEITLLEYKDVLDKIKNQECHLLLGNGFNRGLGVDTSYEAIFQKMIKYNHGIYKDAESIVVESNYDLEQFIEKLVNTINDENLFLKKYINNKIKFDFMKAAHEIVKSKIKNIYAEKNEGAYILFKNFTNYFTLNYDTLLYSFLLNFKSGDKNEERTIAPQHTLKFIEKDMNTTQEDIFDEIQKLREKTNLNIEGEDDTILSTTPMNELTKTEFREAVIGYSKKQIKNWRNTDIDRVIKYIWEEKRKKKILEKVDDGSVGQSSLDGTKEFVFDINKETQNLFFLHGAFHIYIDGKDGKKEKKITQLHNKALYDRLEEILNDEGRDIVCVFQPENKIDEINKSPYLKNAYNKLSKLSGSMVVIGCSLSNNDSHIFKQINKPGIDTLYISTMSKGKSAINKEKEKVRNRFPKKEIFLFRAESISYELPDKQ